MFLLMQVPATGACGIEELTDEEIEELRAKCRERAKADRPAH
jgi:hypothetical protein